MNKIEKFNYRLVNNSNNYKKLDHPQFIIQHNSRWVQYHGTGASLPILKESFLAPSFLLVGYFCFKIYEFLVLKKPTCLFAISKETTLPVQQTLRKL